MKVNCIEEQVKALRRLAARTGRSVADLTRDTVGYFLSHRANQTDVLVKRALSVVGAFTSGSGDGSTAHDRHLVDAFR